MNIWILVLATSFNCSDGPVPKEKPTIGHMEVGIVSAPEVNEQKSDQKAVSEPLTDQDVPLQHSPVPEKQVPLQTKVKEEADAESTAETSNGSVDREGKESKLKLTELEVHLSEPEAEVDNNENDGPELWQVDHQHMVLDKLLQKHVSANGKVNYEGILSDKGQLTAYLQGLSGHPPKDDWSRPQKLAYWINAYNAFTIELILAHYPVKSIQDIAGGKPWDKKWIELGGTTYSLNQIENDVIRPQFNEPRIHFAVNCAAKSCPPLANQAYTPNNLEMLLEKQTKSFISNPAFNIIGKDKMVISKIFDWYGVDFANLVAFINKYSSEQVVSVANISYMDYDWALNN